VIVGGGALEDNKETPSEERRSVGPNLLYSQVSDDERLRHEENVRKYIYELWKTVRDIDQLFFRNLFLINGGGAVAVLGLKGAVRGAPVGWEFWPLIFFGTPRILTTGF
jgi:hypothetical protein